MTDQISPQRVDTCVVTLDLSDIEDYGVLWSALNNYAGESHARARSVTEQLEQGSTDSALLDERIDALDAANRAEALLRLLVEQVIDAQSKEDDGR